MFAITTMGAIGCGGGLSKTAGDSGLTPAGDGQVQADALAGSDGAAGDSGAGDSSAVEGATGGSAVDSGGVDVGAQDTGGPPVASADFDRETFKAACASYTRCGFFPDVTICEAVNPPGASLATLHADIAAGLVAYDAAQARACVDSYAAMPCTISGATALTARPDPCASVFTGTVGLGQVCYAPQECAAGTTCVQPATCTTACCAGTCVAPAVRGGACAGAVCPTGTYCRAQTARCTPQATAEGTVCDSTDGCAPPLFCIPDALGNGTCGSTLPAAGVSCEPAVGCDDVRDYCDANSDVCLPRVGVGQPCAADPNRCVYYAFCDGAVCQAGGVVGALCASDPASGGSSCLGQLSCQAPGPRCAVPAAASCR
jgi:hypothetical protein